MTKASLSLETLKDLAACRTIALQNLSFYVCLYDTLEDGPNRDAVGMAMTQKESFLGAVDAILSHHNVTVQDNAEPNIAYHCDNILNVKNSGAHLAQEERFQKALQDCMHASCDDKLSELLKHHFEAADLALTALKATSLKL